MGVLRTFSRVSTSNLTLTFAPFSIKKEMVSLAHCPKHTRTSALSTSNEEDTKWGPIFSASLSRRARTGKFPSFEAMSTHLCQHACILFTSSLSEHDDIATSPSSTSSSPPSPPPSLSFCWYLCTRSPFSPPSSLPPSSTALPLSSPLSSPPISIILSLSTLPSLPSLSSPSSLSSLLSQLQTTTPPSSPLSFVPRFTPSHLPTFLTSVSVTCSTTSIFERDTAYSNADSSFCLAAMQSAPADSREATLPTAPTLTASTRGEAPS
mmetsp:Transcript_21744/g.56458  ORF Transcript_21744/g.56458 Transcript_21744/m.56458 type:complete len:265 (+) Transcript_21744:411-1205(+)